jgi:hypothetical protein
VLCSCPDPCMWIYSGFQAEVFGSRWSAVDAGLVGVAGALGAVRWVGV